MKTFFKIFDMLYKHTFPLYEKTCFNLKSMPNDINWETDIYLI